MNRSLLQACVFEQALDRAIGGTEEPGRGLRVKHLLPGIDQRMDRSAELTVGELATHVRVPGGIGYCVLNRLTAMGSGPCDGRNSAHGTQA